MNDFVHWIIAIVILLFIMAALPAPYGEWLAGLILLGAVYADVRVNKNQSLFDTILK